MEYYEDSPIFDRRDCLAISWAEAVTTNIARQASQLFDELEQTFTTQEMVELTLMISLFNMVNRFDGALHVELEEPGQVAKITRSKRINPQVVRDYINRANQLLNDSLAAAQSPSPKRENRRSR